MDEVTTILARDFGLRPQGKSAPMAASKPANLASRSAAEKSSWSNPVSWGIPDSSGDPFIGNLGLGSHSSRSQPAFDDIFGGPPVHLNPAASSGGLASSSPPDVFDSLLDGFGGSGVKSSSVPGVFDAFPGVNSSPVNYGDDDVFFSISSGSNHAPKPSMDDLLENLGKPTRKSKSLNDGKEQNFSGTEKLIPGFGWPSRPPEKRNPPKINLPKPPVSSSQPITTVMEDPFGAFETKETTDLESFFSMGKSARTTCKQPTAASAETIFDFPAQDIGINGGTNRTSQRSSPTIKKASSTPSFLHDEPFDFWGPPSSVEFEEIEGESEERRKARLDRHQRTLNRVAKALSEKNERDMQIEHEQAVRQSIAGVRTAEIKQWAAGKEGNLRALLSTMQYVSYYPPRLGNCRSLVLWPECGWEPVSLTDVITAAAVKKVYRKATLCVHPDKVQQRGATLEQKYIAEKVFDLLKEAWKKFNTEELS
ncbi:hypothetical protein ZIOFF_056289 [Zingiber officinale]|uniref:Uncharacterized protein n=1 Tax=Zingiber officinale TaxID=94328 RepID=A0A8J5FDR5_ZINOF|nr:hypothetical protein ZIOFF_056289 [Zingiber officinale]